MSRPQRSAPPLSSPSPSAPGNDHITLNVRLIHSAVRRQPTSRLWSSIRAPS